MHHLHDTYLHFSAEDEVAAACIMSRNALESYAYNLRYTLSKLEGAVDDTIKWLDTSQKGSKEEYEVKQKELEAIAEYVSPFFRVWTCYLSSCLAVSCKDSMALRVVHLVVLVVLEVSLMTPVVPDFFPGGGRLNFLSFSGLWIFAWHLLSHPQPSYERTKISNDRFLFAIYFLPLLSLLFFLYKWKGVSLYTSFFCL